MTLACPCFLLLLCAATSPQQCGHCAVCCLQTEWLSIITGLDCWNGLLDWPFLHQKLWILWPLNKIHLAAETASYFRSLCTHCTVSFMVEGWCTAIGYLPWNVKRGGNLRMKVLEYNRTQFGSGYRLHMQWYTVSSSCLHIHLSLMYTVKQTWLWSPTNRVDDQSSQTGADLHLSTQWNYCLKWPSKDLNVYTMDAGFTSICITVTACRNRKPFCKVCLIYTSGLTLLYFWQKVQEF